MALLNKEEFSQSTKISLHSIIVQIANGAIKEDENGMIDTENEINFNFLDELNKEMRLFQQSIKVVNSIKKRVQVFKEISKKCSIQEEEDGIIDDCNEISLYDVNSAISNYVLVKTGIKACANYNTLNNEFELLKSSVNVKEVCSINLDLGIELIELGICPFTSSLKYLKDEN